MFETHKELHIHKKTVTSEENIGRMGQGFPRRPSVTNNRMRDIQSRGQLGRQTRDSISHLPY